MTDKNYHDDLSHIRSMMERSSRFLSLSGLSGVFAGITALVGSAYAYFLMQNEKVSYLKDDAIYFSDQLVTKLVITGLVILAVAITLAYIFTVRKTKKNEASMWDATTKRLLVAFLIPLIAGGFVSLALLYHGMLVFVAPMTLIFYGLALVSAERYTLSDIKYLGFCEIGLGLLSLFFLGWGFIAWVIGFGVLHIVYGLLMHSKYK